MTNAILVGVDGSPESARAATYAAQIARQLGAKLSVVYVIEWSPYTFNTPQENEVRHKRREQEIELAREKVLQPLLADIGDGIEVEGVVKHGNPAEMLNRLAREAGASQLFIGRTGGGDLKSLLFGGVAAKLVQTAEVPVTVIP